MAPTKRVDDPRHNGGVSPRAHDRRTAQADYGPAESTALDDALRSGSRIVDLQGGRYLGIPQKQPARATHRNPEAHAPRPRDSPAAQ
jgi:hypothetical protein